MSLSTVETKMSLATRCVPVQIGTWKTDVYCFSALGVVQTQTAWNADWWISLKNERMRERDYQTDREREWERHTQREGESGRERERERERKKRERAGERERGVETDYFNYFHALTYVYRKPTVFHVSYFTFHTYKLYVTVYIHILKRPVNIPKKHIVCCCFLLG